MKILYISNEYPPIVHGGIGSFVRDIAEGMVNNNHEVVVWGLYDNINEDVEEVINKVKVIRIRYKKIFNKFNHLFYVITLNWKIYKYLKYNKFDIIESQEWQGWFPLGIKHRKHIIRLHGASVFFDKLLKRKGSKFIHILEKFTIKNAKYLVSVSDFCGKKTLELVNVDKPFKTIYNSINFEKINKFKSKEYEKLSIVFVNSLLPKKGIFELAKAFNKVSKTYPNAKLIFIGKTSYKENKKNVSELILDLIDDKYKKNVEIHGWLDNTSDVYNFISKAHICCYPSHMEGFGIAPVEAMALGKMVFFMNNGPGPEVIENKISGILVDTLNYNSIYHEIINVFENKYNLIEIGNNAEIRAKELFDLSKVFMPINIEFYNSILNE